MKCCCALPGSSASLNRRAFCFCLSGALGAVGCGTRRLELETKTVELAVDEEARVLCRYVLRQRFLGLMRKIPDLDAAMITVRNADSAMLIHIGSIREHAEFDNALAGRRDLGSVCKPFIYAAALQQNAISPEEQFPDEPAEFPRLDGAGTYAVHNYGNKYTYRTLNIEEALALSSNTVAARVYHRVGPTAVRRVFQELRLGTAFSINLLPAGRWNTSLVNLAAAYTVFPNLGEFSPAKIMRTTSGPPRPVRVFSPSVCRVVSRGMLSCLTHGTGTAAADLAEFARGKTGSTSDAIAVLQTRHVTTALWLGRVRSSRDLGMTGGKVAMPAIAECYRGLRRIRPSWFLVWV